MKYLIEGRINAVFKSKPEDFIVTEVLAYALAGAGSHTFLFVEKVGVNTLDVVEALSLKYNIRRSEIGYAGLKDKQAVAYQHFSVPLVLNEPPAIDGVKVLWMKQHINKLRRGHVWANKFVIRLRAEASEFPEAERIFNELVAKGVPNYYGQQRFGTANAEKGKLLLKQDLRAPTNLKRLYLSAYQSLLFNKILDLRMPQLQPMEGDILVRGQPTGPLFGYKIRLADGVPGEMERRILIEEGIDLEAFRLEHVRAVKAKGGRRPLLFSLGEPRIHFKEGIVLEFTLPSGCYATSVVGELTKDGQD